MQFAAAVAARGLQADLPMDPAQAQRYTELFRCLREGGAKVSALDRSRILSWVQQQVTVAQLSDAIAKAKRNREQEGSLQPIGAAYLAAILDDQRKPKGPPWWSSDAAMDAKARECGIQTARPGESRDDYRNRIRAAISAAGGLQA